METLVIVAQHRNQYYSKSRTLGPARFGSPPSGGFRDISCRTSQSGAGILPNPSKACSCSYSSSPKTPSPSVNPLSDESKHSKEIARSSTIPIPVILKADPKREGSFNDEFAYSELWAGPAYSNSPPPSSLPIPRFSVHPKRTVSFEFPASSASDIDFHPIAKSAPASPRRDHGNSSSRHLFIGDDSATKTLRRILNLDIADDE